MELTPKQALQILTQYQKWRRGNDNSVARPKTIGLAIDKAIEVLESHTKEFTSELNHQSFVGGKL